MMEKNDWVGEKIKIFGGKTCWQMEKISGKKTESRWIDVGVKNHRKQMMIKITIILIIIIKIMIIIIIVILVIIIK